MKKSVNLLKRYFTTGEAAFLLGRTISEIKTSIRREELDALRIGERGPFRIPSSEIFKEVKKNCRRKK